MEKHVESLLLGYNAVSEYVVAVTDGIVVFANNAAAAAAGFSLKGAHIAEIFEPEFLDLSETAGAEGRHLSVPDAKFFDLPCMADIFSGEPALFILRPEKPALAEPLSLSPHSIANFSGGLRAPVTSLFTSANLLKRRLTDADEKARGYLSMILQNCYRLIRFSNNLADLFRFHTPENAFTPQDTDLVSFIREIVASVRPLGELKGVPIRFETSVHALLIPIDREKIERLLLNLLANSLKYTREENSVLVRVAGHGNGALLTVSDSGRGIPDELLPHAFQAYRLAGRSASEGYGLGLGLVRSIALQHGGTAVLETRENEGTSVTVSLPGAERSPAHSLSQMRPAYDYAGHLPHTLLELCDVFSPVEFDKASRLTSGENQE